MIKWDIITNVHNYFCHEISWNGTLYVFVLKLSGIISNLEFQRWEWYFYCSDKPVCVCFYHFNMQCIKSHILSIYFVFSSWIYVYMKNYIHFTGQSQRNLTMQTQPQIPSFFLECLPCEASWGPDVEEDASLRRLSCDVLNAASSWSSSALSRPCSVTW